MVTNVCSASLLTDLWSFINQLFMDSNWWKMWNWLAHLCWSMRWFCYWYPGIDLGTDIGDNIGDNNIGDVTGVCVLRLWTWWHPRCGWRTAASLCCRETTRRTAAWTCCLRTAACRSSSPSTERALTTSTLRWWTYVSHTHKYTQWLFHSFPSHHMIFSADGVERLWPCLKVLCAWCAFSSLHIGSPCH